jgi:glycogen debranching enzyme
MLTSFADRALQLPVALEFHTTFEDMFVLRGTPPGKRGRLIAPVWDGTVLGFCYEGADGIRRSLLVDFSAVPLVAPRTSERTIAHFELTLASRVPQDLVVRFRVDEQALEAPRRRRQRLRSQRGRDGRG